MLCLSKAPFFFKKKVPQICAKSVKNGNQHQGFQICQRERERDMLAGRGERVVQCFGNHGGCPVDHEFKVIGALLP
jgi:hypothetical protein